MSLSVALVVPFSFSMCYGGIILNGEPHMAEQRRQIPDSDLEISVSIALKLAKFRRTRTTDESDVVCRAAAKAVTESFKLNGWVVVKDREYPGWNKPE